MTIPVPALELLSEHACFDDVRRFYQHASTTIGLPMCFSIYLLPRALVGASCPALFYLAGPTCAEETFTIEAGAQHVTAREGLVLIGLDTSPHDANVPNGTDSWDFGITVGFYLDATQAPWRRHYRTESYIADELYHIAYVVFPAAAGRISISGHSMGGHGALTLMLRRRERFASVSAFAPIVHSSVCPWDVKALTGYLGDDHTAWTTHDTAQLIQQASRPFPRGILVDQGEADKFLAGQLYPDDFATAYTIVGQPLRLRHHPGYDHDYYFVETFIEDHLLHHAA